MESRHREFQIHRSNLPPPTFTISGERRVINEDTGEVHFEPESHSFTCLDQAPADPLFTAVAQSDEAGRLSGEPMKWYICGVLVEEDERRFKELLADKRFIVPLETLAEVVMFLTEAYSGRPTERPSDSQDGPSQNGVSSTDDSPSVVESVS